MESEKRSRVLAEADEFLLRMEAGEVL